MTSCLARTTNLARQPFQRRATRETLKCLHFGKQAWAVIESAGIGRKLVK
jgi:hypothetical protein